MRSHSLGVPSGEAKADLDCISDLIFQELPDDSTPISIYVSGGFARGESGHYSLQNRNLPFGDYDLDVVIPRPLLEREVKAVFKRIEEEMSYRPVTAASEPTLVEDAKVHNVLDIRFKTREEFIERPPDLAYYDFVHSHALLHGDCLVGDLKELETWEVSLFSPWRILGNRLILCLKHVDTDLLERDPTVHEVLAFRLARCRLYLDLAGMLTFLLGRYSTAYSNRIQTLKDSHSLWRGWVRDADLFLSRLEEVRRFKKEPHLEKSSGVQIFQEWFQAAQDIGEMLPHLINLVLLTKQAPPERIHEIMNKPPGGGESSPPTIDPFAVDWKPLVVRQFRGYPSLFYRDFIAHYIRRSGKNLPAANTLSGFASRYYGSYENATWKGRKWVFKNLRRSVLSPLAFQSAVLPLILFSLNSKFEVRIDALEFFDKLMEPYMPMPFDFLPDLKRWEATKRCLVHEMLDYRKG